MNIIQIKTNTKISTDQLYIVHCVTIPSLHYANFGQFKAKQVLKVILYMPLKRTKNTRKRQVMKLKTLYRIIIILQIILSGVNMRLRHDLANTFCKIKRRSNKKNIREITFHWYLIEILKLQSFSFQIFINSSENWTQFSVFQLQLNISQQILKNLKLKFFYAWRDEVRSYPYS